MKIYIVGTGGVGGYFGGLLAKAQQDVTFVARGEHLQAIKKSGLRVDSVMGDFRLDNAQAIESLTEIDSPDLILVCTKTYDRDDIAQQLSSVVTPSTIVIPIQNGIENDIRMKEFLPNCRVYPGLAYLISKVAGPGHILQSAGPRKIIFGERGVSQNQVLIEIAKLMQTAEVDATASENIEKAIWAKFTWLSTFAGMTAVCRSSIGPIVNDPDCFSLYMRCMDEALAVASAVGITWEDGFREQLIEKSTRYRVDATHAKSSLLVDIENRRRTEIEDINGTIVRLAREHNIDVPVQESLYHAIRTASAAYLNLR